MLDNPSQGEPRVISLNSWNGKDILEKKNWTFFSLIADSNKRSGMLIDTEAGQM